MEHNFWREKWEKNQIAFHEGAPNSLLLKHFARLSLQKGARIFLPLCGKTRDIHWLISQGFRVAGSELSDVAVGQLFAELGLEPRRVQTSPLVRYSATNIDIFQGDIFDVTAAALGVIDAIYDRAALVALPKPMRARYAPHLVGIMDAAPQLLISYAYDQSAMEGPPFSVSDGEVRQLYGDAYDVSLVESVDVLGGLKGKCAAAENVWLLRQRTSHV